MFHTKFILLWLTEEEVTAHVHALVVPCPVVVLFAHVLAQDHAVLEGTRFHVVALDFKNFHL